MLNLIKSYKEFIIGLILTLSLLWPLVSAPFFTHHDDVQIIRLYEMDKCFKDGQIPCRWVPDLGGLYGYPIFNYYAPLPYYFGEILYLISQSLTYSVKFMFAVSFLGAYLFMYLFAKEFWGKLGGSLSAIFYSFAPYHAVDFYVRGAMGEMWGLMIFPAILWALTRLSERKSSGNLLILAIFVAALITSHNLSVMIFSPVAFVWATILFFKKGEQKFLWFSLASVILGVSISAFYLIPMIVEKNLVHIESTTYGYFGYTEHFKGIKELFLRRDWGWGSSIREVPGGEKEKISFQVGWIHLLAWGMALFSARLLWRKNKWLSKVLVLATVITSLFIFMIHPRSEFIWKQIEILKYLQFPWRFLMMVIFFTSFVSGGAILLTQSIRKRYFVWAGLTLAVVLFNFSYFRPEKFLQVKDQDLLSGEAWDRQIKRSILDYLPIYAKEPPAELAQSHYQILTGDTEITDFKKGTNWIKFKADTKNHTIIRLSQYYFPNWRVFIDGEEAKIEYKDNTLGLMTLILGKGQHVIEARLFDTPVRIITNFITLLGLLITVVLSLIQFPYVRKWIIYYRKRID